MIKTTNTIEYNDLEQKYAELKRKFRKIKEHNETLTLEVEKLSTNVKQLESEKYTLENQIAQNPRNDSDDNSSYTNNQANTELIDIIDSKNEQISNLLKDIENAESENSELKENLVLVKNELESATNSIVTLTETLKSKEVLLDEQNETFQSITLELNSLQAQLQLCKNEKEEMKINLDNFSTAITKKIDKWKSILNKKNIEIETLKKTLIKSQTTTPSSHHEKTENQLEINPIYTENLQKKLSTTETQLSRLKIELNSCTENLNESAEILNKINKEKCKIEDDLKIEIVKNLDLKRQLNQSHDRCKKMHQQVEYSGKLSKMLKNELNNLYEKLKMNPEQIETAHLLEEMHRLKIENFHRREKIEKLVKDVNNFQEDCENSKFENSILKKKLELNSNESFINEEGNVPRTGKERLKYNKNNAEEENITLRLEIQQLNKRISDLLNSHYPNNDLLINEIEDLKMENQVLRSSLQKTVNSNSERINKDVQTNQDEHAIKTDEEPKNNKVTAGQLESIDNSPSITGTNKLENLYFEIEKFQMHEQQYLNDIGNLQQEITIWKSRFQELNNELEKEREHFKATLTTLENKLLNNRKSSSNLTREIVFREDFLPLQFNENEKCIMKNQIVQVSIDEVDDEKERALQQLKLLKMKINMMENLLMGKEEIIMKKDFDVQEFKTQMNQKDQQIAMLNKKLEKFQRVDDIVDNGGGDDGINHNELVNKNVYSNEKEMMELQMALEAVNQRIVEKDEDIVKYQNILMENKNKINNYENLKNELQAAQKTLSLEHQKYDNLIELHEKSIQKYELMESYITQVHLLEKHLADMHTQQTKLETQIRCVQDELNRWKQIAQDRLMAMEELGKSLDEQHQKDLNTYKTDNEKLMELIRKNGTYTVPYNNDSNNSRANSASSTQSLILDPEILKLVREKDERIKELNDKIQQSTVTLDSETNTKISITDNEKLMKENRILKRKYLNLVANENKAKEEIGNLKEQLSKRSYSHLPMRSDQCEKNQIKQLQTKVTMYENQMENLNEKLTEQTKIAQKYKIACDENFDNWKKQKYWQENCEKYKTKFEEIEEKLKKQDQACAGHRFLIDRLERDKMNMKSQKTQQKGPINKEISLLQTENAKLICEIVDLKAKLKKMQQHNVEKEEPSDENN